MPLERWDIERLYAPGLVSDKMYTRHAAWLPVVDHFDAALFGFSKAQAVATDPQVELVFPMCAAVLLCSDEFASHCLELNLLATSTANWKHEEDAEHSEAV